jgi:hypothetical protein
MGRWGALATKLGAALTSTPAKHYQCIATKRIATFLKNSEVDNGCKGFAFSKNKSRSSKYNHSPYFGIGFFGRCRGLSDFDHHAKAGGFALWICTFERTYVLVL